MKCQVLFSFKNNNEKSRMSSATVLFSALRDKNKWGGGEVVGLGGWETSAI